MAQRAPRRIDLAPDDQHLTEAVAKLDLPAQTTTLVVNGETGDDLGFPPNRSRLCSEPWCPTWPNWRVR